MKGVTEFYRTGIVKFNAYGYNSNYVEIKKDGLNWHQRHIFIKLTGEKVIEDWIILKYKPNNLHKYKNLIKEGGNNE